MSCNWVKMEGDDEFGMRRMMELDWWRKGPWTSDEDKLLTDYVRLHGEGRWNCVARLTGLKRNGKSCRLRWVNYLRPDLKKCQITPHEETIILDLHARWGNRWSTIARSLPGRTDNEIKNYWRTHFKNKSMTKMPQAPPCGSSHDDDNNKIIKARQQRLLMKKQQFQQQQQQQEQIINQQLDVDMYLLNETEHSMIPAAADHQMVATSSTSSSCCYNNFTLNNNIANASASANDDMVWDIGNTSCLWNLLQDDGMDYFHFHPCQ